MSIADEATGSHLQAKVYDCPRVAQIKEQQALQDINSCFKNWGLPRTIKIDNGHPPDNYRDVNPRNRDIPTISHLWWVVPIAIGIGITVIQNTPRRPQENGIVENLQGTLCTWSNPRAYSCPNKFQQKVNEESEFQRNGYKIPARKYKTRKELFPELYTNRLNNNFHSNKFDITRVYHFLSLKVWQRTIRKKGDVKFCGKYFYIGRKFAHQQVFFTFDPIEVQWMIRDENGLLLKTSSNAIPNETDIKTFALMSKN